MNFFLDAADRFTATVHATTDWSAPSPCEGWTAAEVVDHIVDTERDYLSRMDVALGDRPTGSPEAVWSEHLAAVRPLLTDELRAREYDGFFGRTTMGATLDAFYGFDLVVHGWDLGFSNGRPTTFTEADMDALEAAFVGFGDHAYDEGVFKRPVDTPEGADRQTLLLARMGRRA
ncbi:maleylpyruvate isomerase family mycothiol-dependent enzyme [Nocardioides sp. LMS-CY]|uniref:maleylpyruvate isomerase family mycothiol-dependent enzyme n=1 Tax=Nocardioides sp. (strain LMS-CY) TaxID=2840457 RepID=UPI001C002267|nr:maleylpyruvate isomerase family mycothiol-dependent enzyme [Nocardioides sp. LMS-CY]QWF23351.1 maleylpyruvate isomerase family mycothiol-dependent enzyme [Nocardioides sp. LMS-CY]